jgi:hypothetical protein
VCGRDNECEVAESAIATIRWDGDGIGIKHSMEGLKERVVRVSAMLDGRVAWGKGNKGEEEVAMLLGDGEKAQGNVKGTKQRGSENADDAKKAT